MRMGRLGHRGGLKTRDPFRCEKRKRDTPFLASVASKSGIPFAARRRRTRPRCLPGIHYPHTGVREMPYVSGNHREVMDQSRGCNQEIGYVPAGKHGQSCRNPADFRADGDDALREMNPDGKIEPVLERFGEHRITRQDAMDSMLDLEFTDRGNVAFAHIRPAFPGRELHVPSLRIAQVRDRICIKNEHLSVEADRFQRRRLDLGEIPIGMALQTRHIHRESRTQRLARPKRFALKSEPEGAPVSCDRYPTVLDQGFEKIPRADFQVGRG